jgi:farnesyl-diphosphate farnesyltransferase
VGPADDLLGDLLRKVSRSFSLSLAILPRGVREPVGLAYLLARAADTVADTSLVPRADRIGHLLRLRNAFAGRAVDVAPVARACAPHRALAAERDLLARTGEALDRVAVLPLADRHAVQAVLETVTSGMIFDLERFPGEDASGLAALPSLDDLDHYTYLVAGCVGEFWTAVHAAHRPRLAGWNTPGTRAGAIRFGKGLQMTNVLRDVPRDLRAGRCYLPARDLAALGLRPADLLEREASARARPVLGRLLRLTLEHYEAGWRYTLSIPRREWRMRLACVWPLSIGLGTLARLAAHPDPLATTTPIKLPRSAVRSILARSAVTVWSNRALARDARRLQASCLTRRPLEQVPVA